MSMLTSKRTLFHSYFQSWSQSENRDAQPRGVDQQPQVLHYGWWITGWFSRLTSWCLLLAHLFLLGSHTPCLFDQRGSEDTHDPNQQDSCEYLSGSRSRTHLSLLPQKQPCRWLNKGLHIVPITKEKNLVNGYSLLEKSPTLTPASVCFSNSSFRVG